MKDDHIAKMTFQTRYGYYEFFVMLFGLTNVAVTFIAKMNKVFRQYLYIFLIVFFDDIMIYSRSELSILII